MRAALRRAILEARPAHLHIEREAEVAGRAYKLIVRPMPSTLGKIFFVAAAVPISELAADSRTLLERAAEAAAIAVGLAIVAVLVVSLLLSRSIRRIAAKTERIRNLDFSDRVPVVSRITEILRLSESIERMREGLEVFGRYVSKNLVTPDHALAAEYRRRRHAARAHRDVHRHRGLLAASARPWSRSC